MDDDKELDSFYSKFAEAAKTVTIFTEPGALCFCTRRTWEDLPESGYDQLCCYGITSAFKGSDSLFFLLKSFYPVDWHSVNAFKLLRISMDEDGKQHCSVMALSGSEAEQMLTNKLSIWG